MNKKTVVKLKNIINYNPEIQENKRTLNALKKQFQGLSAKEKHALLKELTKLFENNE
tara:strand:+ start:329 stop:499 length:171 start_codon:yes stop_codon:yes gene_type:complete